MDFKREEESAPRKNPGRMAVPRYCSSDVDSTVSTSIHPAPAPAFFDERDLELQGACTVEHSSERRRMLSFLIRPSGWGGSVVAIDVGRARGRGERKAMYCEESSKIYALYSTVQYSATQ